MIKKFDKLPKLNGRLFSAYLIQFMLLITYRGEMGQSDYMAAGLILLVQLVVTLAYFKIKPNGVALLERYKRTFPAWPTNLNLSDRLDDLFFTGMLIVFTFMLPFGVYLHQPMRAMDILAAFTFSVYFLGASAVFAQSRWKHLPVLSLIGVIYTVFSHPVPNPTASTLILLIVFCFEMAVKIAIQVYKAAKSDIEAF